MARMIQLTLLLAVILTAAVSVRAQQLMELNLEPGTTYYTRMTIDQVINQEMMGQKMDVSMSMQMVQENHVKARTTDGWLAIETKTTRVRMKSEAMGQAMEYNSDQPGEAPMQFAPLKGMIGSAISMEMSPKGEIRNFEGLEEMSEQMFADTQLPESMVEDLKKVSGPETYIANLQMVNSIYPDGPVTDGYTWQETFQLDGAMPMEMIRDITFVGMKEDKAHFTETGSMATTGDGMNMELAGIKMNMQITGTQKASYQLDPETGLILLSVVEQQMNGRITMDGPQQMTMPQTINQKITIENTL